ncbi:MAG: O-antigen ligase family protein [bacterium]
MRKILLQLNKLFEFGLYLFIFLLPLQTRLIIKQASLGGFDFEPGTVSLYLTDIVLVILLIFYFFIRSSAKKNEEIDFIWIIIAGFEFVIIVGLFFAPEKFTALYAYARFLLGVGVFWLISKAKFDNFKMTFSFLSGIFVSAVFGIWQFLSQETLASKWFGLAAHSASDMGASVIEVAAGGRWLRAYGFLDHPNMLGGLIAVGLLFAIAELFKNKNNKNNKNDLFLLAIISVFLVALFFTFSRATFLGFFTCLAIIIFLMIIKHDLLGQKIALRILLLSVTVFFIFGNIYQDIFSARVEVETRLELKSVSDRKEETKIAWNIFRDNKFFGVGLANYGFAVKEKLGDERSYADYQPVHNVYLLVLAETGLIGFMFFIWILSYIFIKQCRRGYLQISLLVLILIMFMFDHWWWSLHFGIFLFWFVLGVIYRGEEDYNRTEK